MMSIAKDQRRLGSCPGSWQMSGVLALLAVEILMLSLTELTEATGKVGMIVNSLNVTMRVTGCAQADIPPFDHLQVSTKVSSICRLEEIDVNGTLTGCTVGIDLSLPSDEYFIQATGVYYVGLRRGKTINTWDQEWCPVTPIYMYL